MKDEKGPNKKKERAIMYISAAMVLSALTITGMRLRNVGIRENDFQLDLPKSDVEIDQNGFGAQQYAQWSSLNRQGAELDYTEGNELGEISTEEETTIVSTGKVEVGKSEGSTRKSTESQKISSILDQISALPEGNLEVENDPLEVENLPEENVMPAELLWGEQLPEGVLESVIALSGVGRNEEENPEAILPTGAVGEVGNLLSVEQQLCQPVNGAVLIPYSMEHVVYFPTLDQYKLHSATIYSGTLGEEVKACGKARITEVYQDSQLGNVVVMELGRGVIAKYGQLQDVQVGVGQIVEKGQVLGTVAEPTRYYSLEGPNVYFALKKDDVPVNPWAFMGATSEEHIQN